MRNSTTFIDYYNKIDAFLEKEQGLDYHESYTKKVRSSKNKIVRKFKDELVSMGELRNAIVHNPLIGKEPIAEPHNHIVKRITFLYEEISNPEKVTPKFQFKVIGTTEDDFLVDLLALMKPRSISQVPIYNEKGRVVELLNTNTIARWLAEKAKENQPLDLSKVKIKELMSQIEHEKNYDFIAKDASLYEAHDRFIDHIKKKKRNLEALFITENGKQHESILGMLTIGDVADKE